MRQFPVEETRRAVSLPDAQQQQAAGPQCGAEPVQDQRDVTDPVEQQRAVDDVERPRRQGNSAQVSDRHIGGLGKPRMVLVDRHHVDLDSGIAEPVQAQFVNRCHAPRLKHANRPAEALVRVVAHRLGERFNQQFLLARRSRSRSRGRRGTVHPTRGRPGPGDGLLRRADVPSSGPP